MNQLNQQANEAAAGRTTGDGLNVEAISVEYGHIHAVREVSLGVRPGEHVAIIGPSGSGKSSLLRSVAGLIRPAAGRITWSDETRADETRLVETWFDTAGTRWVEPEHRRIGMIAQQPALWPHLTARAHLIRVLGWRGVRKRDRSGQTDRLLELVGIAHRATHRPAELSGGEQQRLALARALVGGSRLLLLDEPLGQLDLVRRRELGREMSRIAREMGAAVLHVTHDPTDAMSLADRIVVLEEGRMTQQGTPNEISSKPAGAFVEAVDRMRHA